VLPWETILNTGGVFAISIVLLWLLVDAYKANDKLRAALAELTKALDVRFEGHEGDVERGIAQVCGLVGKVIELQQAHGVHTAEALIVEVRSNKERLEKILARVSKGD